MERNVSLGRIDAVSIVFGRNADEELSGNRQIERHFAFGQNGIALFVGDENVVVILIRIELEGKRQEVVGIHEGAFDENDADGTDHTGDIEIEAYGFEQREQCARAQRNDQTFGAEEQIDISRKRIVNRRAVGVKDGGSAHNGGAGALFALGQRGEDRREVVDCVDDMNLLDVEALGVEIEVASDEIDGEHFFLGNDRNVIQDDGNIGREEVGEVDQGAQFDAELRGYLLEHRQYGRDVKSLNQPEVADHILKGVLRVEIGFPSERHFRFDVNTFDILIDQRIFCGIEACGTVDVVLELHFDFVKRKIERIRCGMEGNTDDRAVSDAEDKFEIIVKGFGDEGAEFDAFDQVKRVEDNGKHFGRNGQNRTGVVAERKRDVCRRQLFGGIEYGKSVALRAAEGHDGVADFIRRFGKERGDVKREFADVEIFEIDIRHTVFGIQRQGRAVADCNGGKHFDARKHLFQPALADEVAQVEVNLNLIRNHLIGKVFVFEDGVDADALQEGADDLVERNLIAFVGIERGERKRTRNPYLHGKQVFGRVDAVIRRILCNIVVVDFGGIDFDLRAVQREPDFEQIFQDDFEVDKVLGSAHAEIDFGRVFVKQRLEVDAQHRKQSENRAGGHLQGDGIAVGIQFGIACNQQQDVRGSQQFGSRSRVLRKQNRLVFDAVPRSVHGRGLRERCDQPLDIPDLDFVFEDQTDLAVAAEFGEVDIGVQRPRFVGIGQNIEGHCLFARFRRGQHQAEIELGDIGQIEDGVDRIVDRTAEAFAEHFKEESEVEERVGIDAAERNVFEHFLDKFDHRAEVLALFASGNGKLEAAVDGKGDVLQFFDQNISVFFCGHFDLLIEQYDEFADIQSGIDARNVKSQRNIDGLQADFGFDGDFDAGEEFVDVDAEQRFECRYDDAFENFDAESAFDKVNVNKLFEGIFVVAGIENRRIPRCRAALGEIGPFVGFIQQTFEEGFDVLDIQLADAEQFGINI